MQILRKIIRKIMHWLFVRSTDRWRVAQQYEYMQCRCQAVETKPVRPPTPPPQLTWGGETK